MYLIFTILFLGIGFLFILNKSSNNYFEIYRKKNLLENYEKIRFIFDEAKELAYEKIVREHITIYHQSSMYSMSPEQFKKITNDYIRQVFDICGNEIINNIREIKGGGEEYDNLIYELNIDFYNKLMRQEKFEELAQEAANKEPETNMDLEEVESMLSSE